MKIRPLLLFAGLALFAIKARAECDAVPASSLAGIKSLSVGGLTALLAGDFDNLTALEWLDLARNRLLGIDADHALFANLPNGARLVLYPQIAGYEPSPPPPCQPEGGFPAQGDRRPAELEGWNARKLIAAAVRGGS